MSLVEKLASSLDRNDEQPNIDLAVELSKKQDLSSEVLELLGIVNHGTKEQRHDAIKVLYELANIRPDVFGDKFEFVFDLLETKDNRLLWGTLALLAKICHSNLEKTFSHLPQILAAAERGSVIAKDNAFDILLQLSSAMGHSSEVQQNIISFLENAAPNQLPMYAEKAATALVQSNNADIVHALIGRLDHMLTDAKRGRLEKAIAKLSMPPKPLALV